MIINSNNVLNNKTEKNNIKLFNQITEFLINKFLINNNKIINKLKSF